MTDCLGCQACEDGPMVTLISGAQVCNYCPAWRDECADRQKVANEMNAMPIEQRRGAFIAYKRERGELAAERLWNVMKAVFEDRKNAALRRRAEGESSLMQQTED